jgi:hypothetical protein
MKKYGLLIVFAQIGLLAFSQTGYQDGSRELATVRTRSQGAIMVCNTCDQGLVPTVRVLAYSVNGSAGYFVSGSVPKSDVELYSTSSGGQVLARKTADEKGQADFTLSPGTKPAFALNHNRRNGNGVSGNAQLYAISGKDLVLNSLRLSAAGNDVRVSWNAAAHPGDWTFVVQRSRDNKQFENVETVVPKSGNTLTGYAITQPAPEQTPLMYYRVEAHYKDGFSVATPAEPMKFVVPSFFQAVPTVFTSSVQLVMAPNKLPSKYVVTDMTGRNKLYSGVITSIKQSLTLKLPAGFYIVSVTDQKGITASQVIIKN